MSERGQRLRRSRRSRRSRRPAGLLLAAAVLVGVAVVLLTSGGRGRRAPESHSPAPPAPSSEQFGVNVNRLFNDRTYTQAQINRQLSSLAQTGATLARSDALWEAAEPVAPVAGVHHYQWGFDDSVAASLAGHRLRWLAIIDYSAPWAQSLPGDDHSPPVSAADYAAFAAAFAARYGPGGAFWSAHPALPAEPVDSYEIWNEPDNQAFWHPAPDAARYTDLYLRARDAIKAVVPAARVIVGGLTAPAGFLPAMVRARPDLPGHIDGVAIHPYGANPAAVLDNVRRARGVLDALGLPGAPLYVTEFGWTTSPGGVPSWAPASLRPSYVAGTLAALGHLDCGIAAAVLYTWVTPERNPRNREDWFGIQPPNGVDSADTRAFAAGVREAAQPAPALSLCGPGR